MRNFCTFVKELRFQTKFYFPSLQARVKNKPTGIGVPVGFSIYKYNLSFRFFQKTLSTFNVHKLTLSSFLFKNI